MLVQQEEDVYLNFVNSIKSDVTKRIYEYNLKLFMEFCGIDKFEDLIGQQDKIITYLMSLRERKLSFNSISTRLNAIYHFYDMNDVSLNKKKIKMFKGENQRKVVDRAYMHEDIKIDIDLLNKELELKSEKYRNGIIRKFCGGYCIRCYNIPSTKVSYQIGDALLVERYCSNCLQYMKKGRSKQVIDKLN